MCAALFPPDASPRVSCVCYGLGCFASSRAALTQLCILLELRDWLEGQGALRVCTAFDPAFTPVCGCVCECESEGCGYLDLWQAVAKMGMTSARCDTVLFVRRQLVLCVLVLCVLVLVRAARRTG